MPRFRFPSERSTPIDMVVDEIRSQTLPLQHNEDLDPLMELVGDARYVLLGEATHGTSDFYTWRERISQRLIEEKDFSFIAVEGDWPDCYRVNRYVRGAPDAADSAREVLEAFNRWPTWMWANREIVDLAEWLRDHNTGRPDSRRAGFYGLDVYSLWDSMRAVLEYLQRSDGKALEAAHRALACFEPYGEDVENYARASMWVPESCADEVVTMLSEVRNAASVIDRGDVLAQFNAEQNAWVAKNAEEYYRTMIHGGPASWNIRDRHMVDTLERLMRHFGPNAKAIVWEHNTHIGDARATDMLARGEVNVGQLVREQHGRDDVVLVGCSSHRGTVIAAHAWDDPMEIMDVPPGRPGSWEDVFHRAGDHDQLLLLRDVPRGNAMYEERGHRAIGVVYRPEYEQYGNYVPTVLPRRYDAVLYIDESQAVHPIHLAQERHVEEETYPTGV